MFRKVGRFLRLKNDDKLLFAEVFFLLSLSKCIILVVPLRKVAPYLGKLNGETKDEFSVLQQQKLKKIKTFIEVASAYTPWKSLCLDQALTGMIMLNRRKIPNRLCLGVKKDDIYQKITAHAWIQCGKHVLIGGSKSAQYTMVASFSRY